MNNPLLPHPRLVHSHLGPLRIDNLTSADIETIIALETSSHSHPWSRANFLSSLTSTHHCWGLWQDDVLLGHIYLSLAAGEAELLLLVIARQAQGQGLGKLLLNTAIELLAARSSQFFLEVRASNSKAVALYETLGFNQIGERRNYYPGKNGGEDALIFGLAFDSIL